MSKLIHIRISKKLFIGVLALFLQITANAQEETVIDHKGTLTSVRNNVVSSGTIAPTTPLEGDIWFDTTDATNPTISVWNGTAWQEIIHSGTTGSLFFAGASGEPTEDNTQLFWDNTNNRLGVGTDSPTNKFEVTGAIRSQGILNSDGTVTGPSYRFSDDTNTGMYSPAADELGFSVGGIEALNIDETSSNTTVTINETLDLDGSVLDENDSAGTAGQILSTTATGTDWIDETITTFESPAGLENTLRYTDEAGNPTDISSIVRSVNGVTPAINGNVAVILSSVTTGLEASRPVGGVDSDIYIVSGEVFPNADRNGIAFIYDDVTGWQEVATDLSTNDARYINVIGDAMTGALVMGANAITGLSDPINNQDAATKNYVDNLNVDDADSNITNEIQDLTFVSGVITLSSDPGSTTIDLSNYDVNASDDFSGAFGDLSSIPAGLSDGDDVDDADNNATNEIQTLSVSGNDLTISGVGGNTVTLPVAGAISTDVGNSISTGTDSGIFYESPIKAFGKIASNGTVDRATTGVTAARTSTGRYRVTLTGVVTDADYIIQLTQPGRGGAGLIGGAGNDDPGISYANQDATGFDVIIGDNDNGGTDRSRFNSEFMFTILDL